MFFQALSTPFVRAVESCLLSMSNLNRLGSERRPSHHTDYCSFISPSACGLGNHALDIRGTVVGQPDNGML